MQLQTVTRATESDLEPVEIYNVLAVVSNVPDWAPIFADAVERIDEAHYCITKSGARFSLEVICHPSANAVDYIREMPNNRRVGAYVRVTPRPLCGSVITMTVPIGSGANESEVARTLEQELADLIRLARRQLHKVHEPLS